MVLRSYYSGKIIPGNSGKNPPISQLDSWPRSWLLLPVFAMFIFRGAIAVSRLIMKLTGKMLQISSVGVDRHAMVSGQHLITTTI